MGEVINFPTENTKSPYPDWLNKVFYIGLEEKIQESNHAKKIRGIRELPINEDLGRRMILAYDHFNDEANFVHQRAGIPLDIERYNYVLTRFEKPKTPPRINLILANFLVNGNTVVQIGNYDVHSSYFIPPLVEYYGTCKHNIGPLLANLSNLLIVANVHRLVYLGEMKETEIK